MTSACSIGPLAMPFYACPAGTCKKICLLISSALVALASWAEVLAIRGAAALFLAATFAYIPGPGAGAGVLAFCSSCWINASAGGEGGWAASIAARPFRGFSVVPV